MSGLVTKAFEIRDASTFIPVIATLLASDLTEEAYLLWRAGYRCDEDFNAPVMVTRLNDCLSGNNADDWPNRTMAVAHQHIEQHFHELETGAVIDVQFILGERAEPKVSERLEGVL